MADGVSLEGGWWSAAVDPQLGALFEQASEAAGSGSGAADVEAALALARQVGRDAPRPGAGSGATTRYLEILATLAAADVTAARVVEPHVDALAILAECPELVDLAAIGANAESTWGVFAAEGPGVRLEASADADGWTLEGTKPWCSLAAVLSHALVTAYVGSDRRLFAVALQQPGVTAHPERWVARGFRDVPSGPTDFVGVRAVPVGEAGWYLARPGFEWGGVGVAACWFGGAIGVGRRVLEASAGRDDELSALHAGRVTTSLEAARAVLAEAARAIDAVAGEGSIDAAERAGSSRGASSVATAGAGEDSADASARAGSSRGADPGDKAGAGEDGAAMGTRERALLAQVARSVVRAACDDVLREAAHALGPAPQALDAGYAARVADLSLYLLQDHGDRDQARVGRMLREAGR